MIEKSAGYTPFRCKFLFFKIYSRFLHRRLLKNAVFCRLKAKQKSLKVIDFQRFSTFRGFYK